MITIENPGMLATIQAAPRLQYLNYGVSESGYMDRFSAHRANQLVGNSEDEVLIEVFGERFFFSAQKEMTVGVAGACTEMLINGTERKFVNSIKLKENDSVQLTNHSHGNLMYISVQGGFNVESILGSASTQLSASLGGFDGTALKKGQILTFGATNEIAQVKPLLPRYIPSSISVRVIKGPDFELLTEESRKKFWSKSFIVSREISRVGYRLQGNKIGLEPKELPSRTVIRGIIQLPPSGDPIVLMAESPTVGGYPRVGCVISHDMDLFSQMKPGNKVRFVEYNPIKRA